MRERPAYDIIVQAESGLMSLTGQPDGPPMMVGEALGDLVAGLYGAWAVSSALYGRERTGRGCHIDLAMFDALLSMLPTGVSRYLATGEVPRRVGNRHPLSAPFGVFRTGDGHAAIAVLNEKLFEAFAATIGRPDLVGDPRFGSDPERARHEAELRAIIEGWSGQISTTEVVACLSAAGIPSAPIADIAAAVTSEQARARALFRADGDAPPLPEQPAHFSGVARGRAASVPKLGEHQAGILAQLASQKE
jgi:CoA:oxalate CoA-transferase